MLYNKVNYTSDIHYLTNVFIYEMDISKANINILRSKNLIDQKTYDYLYNAERMVRQIYIGKLERDNKFIVEELKNGNIKTKQLLFESNNIKDYEILSIKNDAVFIVNRLPEIRDFGLIHFVPKNVYTGFYKIKYMEMYYFYNSVNNKEILDIKGVNDSVVESHKDGLYQFFKDIFYALQTSGVDIALRVMKDFYNQYVSRQLNVNYYRSFDYNNTFKLNNSTISNSIFAINSITQEMLPLIDISTNLALLIDLNKILLDIYFNKYK